MCLDMIRFEASQEAQSMVTASRHMDCRIQRAAKVLRENQTLTVPELPAGFVLLLLFQVRRGTAEALARRGGGIWSR